jgi:hypothetical protein
LQDQFIKYGCRLFDFRVRYDKNGDLTFAHGSAYFHGHVETYIGELNDLAANAYGPTYARIILESNSEMKDQASQEEHFKLFCEYIQKTYTNLVFFGGNRKYDWEVIYNFKTEEPVLDDKYSSTTELFGGEHGSLRAKIDDIYPWLYAKLYNKKNIKKGTDKDCLFIDFVDMIPECEHGLEILDTLSPLL